MSGQASRRSFSLLLRVVLEWISGVSARKRLRGVIRVSVRLDDPPVRGLSGRPLAAVLPAACDLCVLLEDRRSSYLQRRATTRAGCRAKGPGGTETERGGSRSAQWQGWSPERPSGCLS